MDAANLLSGAIGGVIGTILSSLVSYWIFKRQSKIESNRIFVQDLLQTTQKIYLAVLHNNQVEEDQIKYLSSFQAIGLKEFGNLNSKLAELRTKVLSYNEGVSKSLQMTTTSALQVVTKTEVEKTITELVNQIRKLT